MAVLNVIGETLYQWDTGRKLKISLPQGTIVERVDFSTREIEEPLSVKTYVVDNNVVADIPNILLQDSLKITAYVVINHDDGERTVFERTFDVISRPKPSDYVYTETEIKSYEALEERVENLQKDVKDLKENGTDGTAIIDVAELPSENINDKALYRLVSGTFAADGELSDEWSCFCVDELPEIGVPVRDTTIINAYYHAQEDKLYVFVVDEEFTELGIPWGWNEIAVFLDAFGAPWGGIVTDINDATEPDTLYLLLEKTLYAWNGKWVALKDNGTSVEGLVEITDGEPTKESTVMTLNPNAEEVHLYTAEEIDAKLQNLPSGEGGNGSNKTLIGEVVVSGHRKIQPLAIDYSTGIITVDDCSFLPSGKVSYTASRVCIRKNTDTFYPNNVIPSELYSGIGIEKISDNTLYLYKAGTKIESYVESATIDLNAWYIEYSDVTISGISIDLSEIEYGNHLAIEVFSPCTEVKTTAGSILNVTDKDSVKYLSYGATNGIRATSVTGGDDYAFDSIRSLTSTGNVIKGNAMPLKYNYDLKITEDFIYVEAKNIFTVSSSDDKLPTYSFGQKAFLINNNGLKKFTVTQGSNYVMHAEGSYIKIWEVHD